MAKNTEIELKLLLSREGLEKMLQLDFMQQAMRPDSYKKRRLVSTYYDTADMTLTHMVLLTVYATKAMAALKRP